ncbi:hypothetical protein [Gordonia insulae]|uniref:Uncharacterized protein n=1 Tax=Gordonia insulae TaxID=2420509 RepID=A0A3G8JQP0_9ACTN|nr:hypothetical protein [Gordonia insulae]AZG47464.1 hypothetical protein D7316_04074 [Gordonia insulae]
MEITTHIVNSHPRSRLFGSTAEYHRARPGHSTKPRAVVTGIQEQDATQVSGDVLAEWDILFHGEIEGATIPAVGDVLAYRTVRRARHSRTTSVEGDAHPVVLLAEDVPFADAESVWRRVLESADLGGTLSDVLAEYRTGEV